MGTKSHKNKSASFPILKYEDCLPDEYPVLNNLSSAFLYQFLPIPNNFEEAEYVYLNLSDIEEKKGVETLIRTQNLIAEWNIAWESGSLRTELFVDKIPDNLTWLKNYKGKNVFLLPYSPNKYFAYEPILNLLNAKIRYKYDLPLTPKGTWPHIMDLSGLNMRLPKNFVEKLSKAFAIFIWPLINTGSKISAFNDSYPLKILSHNLDYWLPYLIQIIQKKLKEFDRCNFENKEQKQLYYKIKKDNNKFSVQRPLKGGDIWRGEEAAWQIAHELVSHADENGNLRAMIDAIKSNNIEDDFSKCWSFAKEDFERKIFKKRNKYKVNFVELNNTIPVQGPDSELLDNLLWQDFLCLLNKKEKRIVVCLKNGYSKLSEISNELGYANHSPISKSLTNIRKKALLFIENS